MARLKIPGKKKDRPVDMSEKKVPILRIKKQRLKRSKKKQEVIRPMVITLRRFREIFGDSDDEEEDFLGFRAEDVGLKAYRSFSTVSRPPSPTKGSHSTRTFSRQSSFSSVPESPTKPKPGKLTKKWYGAVVENSYAKQYKKRDSYERKYSPLQLAKVKQRTVRKESLQDGKRTKESNERLKSKPHRQIRRIGDRQQAPPVKSRPATIAQQLLAKAKEGKRLQIQRQQRITTDTSEQERNLGDKAPVRSRSGRIVKPKKLDYDDFVSPRTKSIRTEAIDKPAAGKRPREESGSQPPAKKQLCSVEVKLEKLAVDVDRAVCSHGSGSRTSSRSHSSDSDSKVHRVRLKNITIPEDGVFEDVTFNLGRKKVRVKNLSVSSEGNYEQAIFPALTCKRHKVRVKNAFDSMEGNYEYAAFPGKTDKEREKRQTLDQQALTGTVNSKLKRTTSSGRLPPPKRTSLSPSSYVFKSKRLQELQVKKEIEDQEKEEEEKDEVEEVGLVDYVDDNHSTKCELLQVLEKGEDISVPDNHSVGSESRPAQVNLSQRARRKLHVESDRESITSSKSSVSSANREKKLVKAKPVQQKRKVHELSESDRESIASSRSGVSLSSRGGRKKQSKPQTAQQKTRVQQLKQHGLQQTESSEDEESNLPLSVIQKDLKERGPKKVVKIIKVMKRYKTKDGKVKTKVVKVIKKMKRVPPGMVTNKRRIKCGDCTGCRVLQDCRKCSSCRDKPKFGGPGTGKQICVKRKCLDPQPPRAMGGRPSRSNSSAKGGNTDSNKSKAASKSDGLKKKNQGSTKNMPTKQGGGAKVTTSSPALKFPPKVLRQVDNKPCIKLSWSDSTSEEDLWKTGFHICMTSCIPEVITELCFLCGSAGLEKIYHCNVCAEPFHGFCLDEEPVDELTWCCDNCSSCSVCGFQNNLLMCDRCQRGYHTECLGPNYPTEPEGEEDVWVCARCVKCSICGHKTAGNSPDATWLHEFSHCFDCGRAWEKGNICPLCEKCYSDNDFDSKMMQCARCDLWIHSDCEGLTADQYECLSELPEDIPYICKKCDDSGEATPRWYIELMEEMQAGFDRILDEVRLSKSYQQLQKVFGELQTDNGHPRDLAEIQEKVKQQKYLTVGDFCKDLLAILCWIRSVVKGNLLNVKQGENLLVTFYKELASMFPWHKISTEDEEVKEPQTAPLPPNGIVMATIPQNSWDHTYALLNEEESKAGIQSRDKDVPKETSAGMNIQKCSISPESIKEKTDNLSTEEQKISPDVCDSSMGNEGEAKHQIDEKPAEQLGDSEHKTTRQIESAVPEAMDVDCAVDAQRNSSEETIEMQEDSKDVKDTTESLLKKEEGTAASKVVDTRKCLLCGEVGEAQSAAQGRLLYSGLDEWVHINCGLWSAEVFEDDHGCLQNVQTAICRGKQMKCEYCIEAGATVGCCENRCPENYHFMCGRSAGAIFQDDKKVYCAQHSFRAIDELIMEDDDFRVDRRVCVDMSKIRATKKVAKGVEPATVKVLQGAMIVDTLGIVSEASDTRKGLFPVDYRTSRLYWSTVDPKRRCRYYCIVQEKETIKSPSCREHEDKLKQEDINKVIAHDEGKDVKQKEKRTLLRTPSYCDTDDVDLTCSESSHHVLDMTYNNKINKGMHSAGKPNHVIDNSNLEKCRKSHLSAVTTSSGSIKQNVTKPTRVYPTLAPKPTTSTNSTSGFVNSHRNVSCGVVKPSRVYPGMAFDNRTIAQSVKPAKMYPGLPPSSLFPANSSISCPNRSSSKPLNIYPKPPSHLISTFPNFVVNKSTPCTQQSSRVFPGTPFNSHLSVPAVSSSIAVQNRNFSNVVNSAKPTSSPKSTFLPCPKSPLSSPQKMVKNIQQQSFGIPSMLTYGLACQIKFLESSQRRKLSSDQPATKVNFVNPSAAEKISETPNKGTKSRSKNSKTAKKNDEDKKCEDELSNFFQCEHEIVSAGEIVSPKKNFPDLLGVGGKRDQSKATETAESSENLMVNFIITNDEGLRIEAESCEAAWKQVVQMVQCARTERNMKYIPFVGMDEMAMLGLKQESIVFLLEQLPGAHQLKHYNFKYNPPFAVSETKTKKIQVNPHGSARAEFYNRLKRFRDIFGFLASPHRPPPPKLCEDDSEDAENFDTSLNGPVFRRPTYIDLPMAMRYRLLKQNNFNKGTVAVYRSPIHGRGLFCLRNIGAGEMVIEYSGMLIRSVLTDKREKYYESKGIGCYMFRVDGTYVVDATTSGNCARFINHSCDPNCYSRVITVDGQKKIIIFASRSISRGDELTYDYKFPIEDEKLPCHCGFRRCRKYLN